MALYFISDVRRIFVKIGVSKSPTRRLCDLQAASPLELELLYVVENWDRLEEQALHQHFARYWLHREWFEFSADIVEVVEALRDGRYVEIPRAPYPNYSVYDSSYEVWAGGRECGMRELRRRALAQS